MSETTSGIVFAADELLPDAWRSAVGGGPVRMFNPALLAHGQGGEWLFAYRVVAPDGLRRIALCRLDAKLRVIPGSAQPLSDGFRFRPGSAYPDVVHTWFADPRLYRFGSRLFLYWNSGWHEPQNHQFVHELDSRTLTPLGWACELTLASGARQKLEKNWTLFGDDIGRVHAVYSVTPHRVIAGSLAGDGDLRLEEVAATPLALEGFPACHGGLRGGTPPQRTPEGYLSFCHSVHDGTAGYVYAASAYRFAAHGDFAPTHRPRQTLPLANPFGARRVHAALNPAVGEVLYPCGAARAGERWLVSHGINDEHCAISILTDEQIDATLEPVPR